MRTPATKPNSGPTLIDPSSSRLTATSSGSVNAARLRVGSRALARPYSSGDTVPDITDDSNAAGDIKMGTVDEQWVPVTLGETTKPNGNRSLRLKRNSINSNTGLHRHSRAIDPHPEHA
jgi:hypothetical protein